MERPRSLVLSGALVLFTLAPATLAQHPEAITDCSNCHLDRETQEPDIRGLHGFECTLCHTNGFESTLLGPIGVWDGQCTACHNPCMAEWDYRPEPTKGHRCVACHGRQLPVGNPFVLHEKHIESANCVVCHGFIPDVGTEIESGNRDICVRCHGPGDYSGIPQRAFHREHVPEGLSCLECHGDERPPVDVVDGPPIGSSTNVCQICHSNQSPADFREDLAENHKKHTDKAIDCGSCHKDANLQDDRDPMPDIDDPVRALLDRSPGGACSHCHEDGGSGPFGFGEDNVHEKHVAEQWQWCFTCHGPDDGRPLGLEPPVQAPAEACMLCHEDESYDDAFPFFVHREHAEKNKCYACHQGTPPLFDWPGTWWIPSEECPCPADINGDGETGFNDLLVLLAIWGNNGGRADIDDDGLVGFSDLVLLLSAWGPCE